MTHIFIDLIRSKLYYLSLNNYATNTNPFSFHFYFIRYFVSVGCCIDISDLNVCY